jgi:hypothetical protein
MMSTWFKATEVNYKLQCNHKHVTNIYDLTLFLSLLKISVLDKVQADSTFNQNFNICTDI